ncbi:hypothetical protein SAMN05444422_101464 [Halobiforma haloterrestris]|uniref:Uncharacterized protein n=1 Tax=Natronobacterium haloterrestre TaxID=148448 RepID=A0A1I1DHT3_NATHA|nr:hypothetical protein [Halobiforma haloterrestris]SFB72083.1 hypothetical protein SAMN05444422_101464 [Halobiforma haloterrestris]
MSNVTTIEDDYEYPGWLVFNGLFQTSVHGEGSMSPQEIVDSFDKYSPGSPNEPDSGFEVMDLSEKLQQMGELTQATEDFAQGLHSLRYVDEDWMEQWGYDEHGKEEMYFLPNHDEVRVYWDYVNDVMAFKGRKQLLQRKQDDLIAALSGDMKMEPVNFDFDFFLWILYKQYEQERLSDDLRVRNITRGSTSAETKDNMGAGDVKDSNNILRSVLMIAPILSGKKIDKIQGNFIMGNHQVKAQIEFGGKVHVKVSDSPLSTLSDLRRMGVSLRLLSELVTLFDDWEHLEPEDRYPPPSFFDDMADNAEEEGWGPRFDPEEVKARYERKRQGTPDDNYKTAAAEDAS